MAFTPLFGLLAVTFSVCSVPVAVRERLSRHHAPASVGDIAAQFEALRGEAAWPNGLTDVMVPDLVQVYEQLARELSTIGFSAAGYHLDKNNKFLAACGRVSFGACLKQQREATVTSRHRLRSQNGRAATLLHTLAANGKPAVISLKTPLAGILWTTKIVGFMGELFQRLSGDDAALHDIKKEANRAFDRQVGTCWGRHPRDSALKTVVKNGIMTAVPNQANFIRHFGNAAGAMRDMKRFADVVVPLSYGIRKMVLAMSLDDCKTNCWYHSG